PPLQLGTFNNGQIQRRKLRSRTSHPRTIDELLTQDTSSWYIDNYFSACLMGINADYRITPAA
ncbi:hypothetical protein, partial [Streptomyces sp. NPDC055085]